MRLQCLVHCGSDLHVQMMWALQGAHNVCCCVPHHFIVCVCLPKQCGPISGWLALLRSFSWQRAGRYTPRCQRLFSVAKAIGTIASVETL